MATIPVSLQKVSIRNLDPNLDNVLIVGIIIGKSRPKKFLDPKAEVDAYRGVWSFTLRDSPQDYINVTYWNSSEVVFQANDKFHTGDVVEVINPRIIIRKINDYSEQFRPMVTSPFGLSLNERSSIIKHDGDPRRYLTLLRYPTKPVAGFMAIRDVHNNGANIKDTHVDILGAIRGLGAIRTINTKNKETLQVRTIEVFDHTAPSLKIEIWEPDIISRSINWKPRVTAVFFADLRICWSSFERSYIAKVSSRTIVTENPHGAEVEALLSYAQNAPIQTFEIVDQLVTALPDPSTIQDVMSIKQIQDKINHLQESTSGTKQFTALVFAFVSSLDLDGLSRTLIIKCGRCKAMMNGLQCENSECLTAFDNEVTEPEIVFAIKVMLTDHTGTLTNCRFSGLAAEQALNCTAQEFSNMSDDEKCVLKWKYLMERCAVRIAVLFIGRQNPIISIVHLTLANTLEVARRLPVY
ncbi:hypothetical protein NQ315_005497 [Exocentrus adspersus]|uniref:MEIOB-like N-terminal domain-containing protein n=1 Tax=Exocentrus adspersus TaxID=1586481 RepID=A0AAV8VU68_9CUCU|nr:hypothetical protein NQ315_005497 [Exocentrus adspersus]